MNFKFWGPRKEDILQQPAYPIPKTKDYMLWENSLNGNICFGTTGSGKTSGFGQYVLDKLLTNASRPGGLILCVKQDDRIRYEGMIEKAGRCHDKVVVSYDQYIRFNAISYELNRLRRGEVNYDSVVDIMVQIFLLGEQYQAGGTSTGGNERFWEKALRRLLSRLLRLVHLSGQTASVKNMHDILVDCLSEEDIEQHSLLLGAIMDETVGDEVRMAAQEKLDEWCKQNSFVRAWELANSREDLSEEELERLKEVFDYFFKHFNQISEKTKAIIIESAMGLFEPFLSGILKTHFSGKMSAEALPERCYKEGIILLVCVPIKEDGLSAIYANGMVKLAFQKCMERRVIAEEENPRPVFFWCDESHLLISSEDAKFQSTCRSVLCATYYITQSVNALEVAFGGQNAKAITKAFLTNVGNSFFCANLNRDTNHYAAELIGKQAMTMGSISVGEQSGNSQSYREERQFVIPPEYFVRLRTGGEKNKYKVECVLVSSSKNWKTGLPYCEITFDQRGEPRSFWDQIKRTLL